MTLPELHQNEALRRAEFPIAARVVFLAHAAVCPLPRRVSEAIRQCAARATEGDQEALEGVATIQETRSRAAELLGVHPEEISLVGPTSLGLSVVAGGLPIGSGENIIIHGDDYPSNVYPWMALEKNGVEVRQVRPRELGRIEWDDVEARLDERTRLVALASCHFISGYRIAVEEIGARLRERGVWFCVDAIQTAGAFPLDASAVDFLAADAHKWLLGPCAAGILYVRRELQELLRPIVQGWNNMPCPDFVAQEEPRYRLGPRRFEPGAYNFLGAAGLKAALELLLEIGVEAIARELLRKRAWVARELIRRKWRVLHADAPPGRASAILSFDREDENMEAVFHRLSNSGMAVSLRTDRAGRKRIRISPHFYNSDGELERFFGALAGGSAGESRS